jgi:tripartite-type tricarboxylate transporter receptor subunit TctC
MQHVPYRGTAPALNDLMGGYIQLMFSDMSAALPLINSGKIRALAVTTKQRVSALPDVAPLAEAGVPGYDVAAWQGVIAPAQTPEPVQAKLNTEINAIVSGEEIRTRLKALGMIPAGTGTVPELQKFLDAEIVRWGQVVRDAGIAGTE